MSDEWLMELRGKVLATNRWMPNRLYIYEDRVEEVVPARSVVTAALGKNQRHTIRYDQVAAVSLKTGVGWGALTIESTGGHTIVVKGINKKEGEKAKQLVQERLDATRRAVQQPNGAPPAATSAADEIAKFAALRDSGAISEEEFAAAKRRILGT